MNPPAFKDCHPFLNPEQRFIHSQLRKQKAGPTAITRMRSEQLGKGGAGRRRQYHPPRDFVGRETM